jgi:hypothetical protein
MQHSADPPEPDPDFIKWLKEHCVPIVGMVLGALVLCLVTRYSSITVDWTRTKEFTEAIANVSQSLALLGGGVWAYFKFAKGRTFQDRLIPNVSGMFVLIEGSVFLIVTMQFKNVGLSRIAFDRESSSLVVFEYVASEAEEILAVKSNRLASFRVFADKDKYVEPNEIVERQRLIALPRIPSIGYQLEVEVGTDSGYRWRATAIVDKSGFDDNEVG